MTPDEPREERGERGPGEPRDERRVSEGTDDVRDPRLPGEPRDERVVPEGTADVRDPRLPGEPRDLLIPPPPRGQILRRSWPLVVGIVLAAILIGLATATQVQNDNNDDAGRNQIVNASLDSCSRLNGVRGEVLALAGTTGRLAGTMRRLIGATISDVEIETLTPNDLAFFRSFQAEAKQLKKEAARLADVAERIKPTDCVALYGVPDGERDLEHLP